MDIERLRLASNGLVEAHSEGPMCWHDDCVELQCQLAEANRKLEETLATGEKLLATGEKLLAGFNQVSHERDALRAVLVVADALRNYERGMVPK